MQERKDSKEEFLDLICVQKEEEKKKEGENRKLRKAYKKLKRTLRLSGGLKLREKLKKNWDKISTPLKYYFKIWRKRILHLRTVFKDYL